ncbi:putative siderophore transport system ATP-binding protein YusV [Corynebacterium auris]|nr:putative siderophore transport system ATP-binding protein YusV [Corynebacterium auris]
MTLTTTVSTSLRAENLTVAYRDRVVIEDLSVAIPDGEFTAIVGPNACGKSTLLKALARMVPARAGTVYLGDRPVGEYKPKEVARQLGLLPQAPTVPDGIVVADLVARGRYPYQGLLRQWSREDEEAVSTAMRQAGVGGLAGRPVAELSGGQRQRVWLALVLAQSTPIVLLDEPTTYLDITHQVEVLNLARDMQRAGRTVVAVLHELTLAFRYATHLIVMRNGAIAAQGPVKQVVTEELISSVYGLECSVLADPETGRPIVLPRDSG